MYDIVIVGGGAAGIGAARRLAGSQCDTLLIEAAPRLGGRAHTVSVDGLALDLGCGWLHSADRNSWAQVATERGMAIDRRPPAWGKQHRDFGFTAREQHDARGALNDWIARLADAPPADDNAASVLPVDRRWHAYIRAMTGFISGVSPDRISAADFTAYDQAATGQNWRVAEGYGALIAGSLPHAAKHRLGTALQRLALAPGSVRLDTTAGTIQARTVIVTVSTAVLVGDTIRWPAEIEPWRDAAYAIPLGRNEKLFLRLAPNAPFEDETQLLGNPNDPATGAYYIRPFGRPVIECFLGGDGAALIAREGQEAGYAHAIAELSALLGSDVRSFLQPVAASDWTRTATIGGGYSCALPGGAAERRRLAAPFENRLFFAGEATSSTDFSTAHGAYASGMRAAEEALAALSRSRPA